MTVSNKLKICLSNFRNVQSSLESFALETDNLAARQSYSELAEQTKGIVQSLDSRLRQV